MSDIEVEAAPLLDVSIVIALPVLNEIENVDAVLDGIGEALAGESFVVVVVDDGSTDGTLDVLDRRKAADPDHLMVIQQVKRARGCQRGGALATALRWGVESTSATVFVEMDGDRSHRPEELPVGIGMVRGGAADVVIASKYLVGSAVTNRPFGRRLVSRVCSAAVGALIDGRIRDYSNGYRFYDRAAATDGVTFELRYTSPIYLTEILALWLTQGRRVAEFPSIYIGRNEGLSKLRPIDLAKGSLAIFEIAARYRLRRYRPRPAPR